MEDLLLFVWKVIGVRDLWYVIYFDDTCTVKQRFFSKIFFKISKNLVFLII